MKCRCTRSPDAIETAGGRTDFARINTSDEKARRARPQGQKRAVPGTQISNELQTSPVEQRRLRFWGLSSESEDVPGVLLSEAYHGEITSTIRSLMKYGRTYSPREVLGHYRVAYEDNPAMLRAVEERFSDVFGLI